MKKIFYILSALLFLLSCSRIDDDDCDNFSGVSRYQVNTKNGLPYGVMSLNIQGSPVRNYSSDLPAVLSQFNQWKSLYRQACGSSLYTDDEIKYYHEMTVYYANRLIAQYQTAKNLLLDFDGVSAFIVRLEPVDTYSAEPDSIILTITDLAPADIGVELTLDSTTLNRHFSVEHNGAVYSSLEAGSILKMKILSIRPVNEITTVEIIAGSILFDDTGNMESVAIEGTLNAYRKE